MSRRIGLDCAKRTDRANSLPFAGPCDIGKRDEVRNASKCYNREKDDPPVSSVMRELGNRGVTELLLAIDIATLPMT